MGADGSTLRLGHMTKCGGEPRARRWLLADDAALLEPGAVRVEAGAEQSLAALVDAGVVERIATEPRAVWVWLAEGAEWREWAPRVDGALRRMRPGVDFFVDADPDLALRLIAADVVHGQLAPYISSHGGVVDVRDVRDGTVTVTFGGACGHCPLSDVTLHLRIEAALRERFPDLDEVRDATARENPGLFAGLLGKRRK